MEIDARRRDLADIFAELKGLISDCGTKEMDLEVITGSRQDASRIAAFAGMSGFCTKTMYDGESFIVSISGSSCGCFR